MTNAIGWFAGQSFTSADREDRMTEGECMTRMDAAPQAQEAVAATKVYEIRYPNGDVRGFQAECEACDWRAAVRGNVWAAYVDRHDHKHEVSNG